MADQPVDEQLRALRATLAAINEALTSWKKRIEAGKLDLGL
jgi:hypothetical protein